MAAPGSACERNSPIPSFFAARRVFPPAGGFFIDSQMRKKPFPLTRNGFFFCSDRIFRAGARPAASAAGRFPAIHWPEIYRIYGVPKK